MAAALALAGVTLAAGQEIPPYPPPGIALSRVALVSMGGEIAEVGETPLETSAGARSLIGPEQWLEQLPELALIAHVTPVELGSPHEGSRAPAFKDWHSAARRIQELADGDGVDGIVVAHPTGTMAEAAYFMNLVVRTGKPIVFVGALRPWTAIGGDGPLNLYNAVRVAASEAAAGKGVLVAMNQHVDAARDVIKTGRHGVGAFRSVELGVIGVADPDVVKLFSAPTRRHTEQSEFDIASLPRPLPPVEIVLVHAQASCRVIDALVAAGVRGLVIDGAPPSAWSAEYVAALRRALDAGVVAVAPARTRGGRSWGDSDRRVSGVLSGDNLAPEKARILLQLALTKTSDPSEIRRFFEQY
jgi:L-asparaginase